MPPFSFAFQPIVDVTAQCVRGYEALVRGAKNEPAAHVLFQVTEAQMYQFDELLRTAAVTMAARLKLDTALHLNFLPRALDTAATTLTATTEAAARANIAVDRLVLEMSEGEIIHDHQRFATVTKLHREHGMRIALDDFGADYAALRLLADVAPDIVKLDMKLIRAIDSRPPRQALVRAIAQACDALKIEVIAKGLETEEEFRWLVDAGLRYFQGNLFAEPQFEQLATPRFPDPVVVAA